MRLILLLIFIWVILFSIRALQIGGLDPYYYHEKSEPLYLQQYFSEIVQNVIPAPESALVSGIVLGDGSKIPYFLKNDLQATSTIHIVVVSGQNLTILAGFIMSMSKLIGRKKSIFLTLFAVLFYCILTGLQIPVIRAGIMAVVSLIGQALGRDVTGWWILLLTAGLMLLYNPNWLMSISFQLSFLATFGVVVVAPILIEALYRVPSIIKEEFGVALSAQALTLPIIAYNFNQMSLFGIVINVLIGWTIPLVMISGALMMLLGTVSLFLAQVVAIIPMILLRYFIYLVLFFADLPHSSVYVPESSIWLWIGYYLILIGIIIQLRLKLEKRPTML